MAGCLVERGGGQEEGEGRGEVEEGGKRQPPPPARARHQLQDSSTGQCSTAQCSLGEVEQGTIFATCVRHSEQLGQMEVV